MEPPHFIADSESVFVGSATLAELAGFAYAAKKIFAIARASQAISLTAALPITLSLTPVFVSLSLTLIATSKPPRFFVLA
jgi:hypothetical protein